MQPIKNSIYKVEITGYTSEGLGVCKIEDFVVFVNNAVKGDIAEIKIVKVTKKIAYGIITTILIPSVNRISPECQVSQKCGGCSLWHMSYDEELEFKREKVENVLKRVGKVDCDVKGIVASNNTLHYRNKAQYPVSNVDGQAIFGFYRKNSHDIVENDNCLIQTKKSNEIAKFITDFLNLHKISAYDEKKHKGVVRHIYTRVGFKSNEIMLCLVVTSFNFPKIDVLCDDLKEKFPQITTFILNKNDRQTNQILGEQYKIIFGCGEIKDEICDNTFNIAPQSFYQINRDSAEQLYEKAIEFCSFTGEETVLDMYCGVGTITLAVAKHVRKVNGIEIIPEAIKNAKNNAKYNDIDNAEFIVGDAKDAVKCFENQKIDVIIVDPPRKGLDIDTVQSIIKINPQKICYVSCDPATLARDIKMFSESGYTTEKAVAFDLFPRTFHVETVCLLSKP
ncbi:MAG: 23S rRNA (uracil(1939)-C(5))-methyltransferase RlmD [Clostridia bacterium]